MVPTWKLWESPEAARADFQRVRLADVSGGPEENIEIRESPSKRANESADRLVVSSGLFRSTVAQTNKKLKAEILRCQTSRAAEPITVVQEPTQ